MITRDVAVWAVDDLALRPPRAALAATVDGEIVVYPVRVTVEAPAAPGSSARIVQVPQDCPDLSGCNVVVIADDGPQWFRLRALTIRGTAAALADRTYRIPPERIVAWDYGRLREAPTPPATATPREVSFSVINDNHGAHPVLPPNLQAAVGRSRVMILASRSSKGTPFAVPLWFVAHRGRIYLTTAASSWTVRNVVSCPQVALLLGGERDDNTAARLLVRGSARARRYTPPPAVLARIAWRYYGQPRFAMVELQHIRLWTRRMRYYRQAQAAHIVFTPETATECQVPPP